MGIGCFQQGDTITWIQIFTSDTTSGSVPTGRESTMAYVEADASNLSLYCGISGTSFTRGYPVYVPVGKKVNLEVRNYNQGTGTGTTPVGWPLTVHAVSFAYRDVEAYKEYYTFSFLGKEIEVTGLKENGSQAMPITLCSGYYGWGTNIKVYHEHTPGAAATCTTDQICTECKKVVVGATGHSWKGWTVTKEASVFSPKTYKNTCKNCGLTKTQTSGTKLTPYLYLNFYSFTLQKGQTFSGLKITGMAAGDKISSIKPSSSKRLKVVKKGTKVNSAITVKALKKLGSATLTIKTKAGATATVRIYVQKDSIKTWAIEKIPKKLTLKKGKTKTLKPVLFPLNSSQKLTYKSSNKNVVTVNSKGKLKAKRKGKATITVKSGSISVKCKVTVK